MQEYERVGDCRESNYPETTQHPRSDTEYISRMYEKHYSALRVNVNALASKQTLAFIYTRDLHSDRQARG